MKVYSGEVVSKGNDKRFSVANVLQLPSEENYGDSQWILDAHRTGKFILNLGCSDDFYNAVDLVNVWNVGWSTNRFKVYLR